MSTNFIISAKLHRITFNEYIFSIIRRVGFEPTKIISISLQPIAFDHSAIPFKIKQQIILHNLLKNFHFKKYKNLNELNYHE